MDSLSALSLAACICQFVDFGRELLAKGHEIYHSSHGTTDRFAELGLISEKVDELSTSLENALRPVGAIEDLTEDLRQEYRSLLELAKASQAVSAKLSAALEAVRSQDSDHRKWKSFYAAFKHHWGKDKVQDLERRLESLRTNYMRSSRCR